MLIGHMLGYVATKVHGLRQFYWLKGIEYNLYRNDMVYARDFMENNFLMPTP